MTLEEIFRRCKTLPVFERRDSREDYIEIVFYAKDTDEWICALAGVLGAPVKPPGEKPSRLARKLTKPFGGVWENQTFFMKEFTNTTVVAMFWPWGNGEYTTLKMFVKE